jgi:hypothetical protein
MIISNQKTFLSVFNHDTLFKIKLKVTVVPLLIILSIFIFPQLFPFMGIKRPVF